MILFGDKAADVLSSSVQINNGFTDTSGDGVNMAFDKKYGIMFCVYMPGPRGAYGESRDRISLSYFPASQPTNIRFVNVSVGNHEYVPNILSLGGGRVRLFYEKNSWAEGDHFIYYKDFDSITETFGEEGIVMLKREDGSMTELTGSEQFAYLERNGLTNHTYFRPEQITIGGHTIQRADDGTVYGSISSFLAEPILYRSSDNLATMEFFAACPHTAQYEFDYKILNGKIYGIGRTNRDKDSIYFTTSEDMGKTWSDPEYFENSIQCRPRIIISNNDILMSYNYFNGDTKNRPAIQQGRTSIRLVYGEKKVVVADLYSKYGIVNVCLCGILNDIYLAYSTSELALEYQNGNPTVRGKDAVRYVKLGDLTR